MLSIYTDVIKVPSDFKFLLDSLSINKISDFNDYSNLNILSFKYYNEFICKVNEPLHSENDRAILHISILFQLLIVFVNKLSTMSIFNCC